MRSPFWLRVPIGTVAFILAVIDMTLSHSLICEHYDASCQENNATGKKCPNQQICEEPEIEQAQACMAVYENSTSGFKIHTKSCFSFQRSGGLCQETEYCANDPVYSERDTVFCCCTRPMCNSHLKFHQPSPAVVSSTSETPTSPTPSGDGGLMTVLLILVPISILGLLVVLGYFGYRRYRLNRYLRKAQTAAQRDQMSNGIVGIKSNNGGQLRNIVLIEIAAQGRFGQVWRAKMGDQITAVKVFPHQDADSWVQEQDIYSINGMKQHANILHFIAAEVRGSGPMTEYWLITTFHNNGSLTDYLRHHELTVAEALHIAIGMLRGLTFLHEEILMADGSVRKPTIVHRDFKSRNVLLHDDMTACIADFGLALKCEHGRTPQDTHGQVGTRRYMSPEVLEGATEFSAFAFRQIDVYAAALCLWEIVSRTKTSVNDPITDYKLPFEAEVGPHPSLGDMQDVVVSKKMRPKIQQHWYSNPQTRVVCNTMEEMWDTEPEARITAGCAFERMAALLGASMIDTLYLTHDQHHAATQGVQNFQNNPSNLFMSPGIPPPSYDHCTTGMAGGPPLGIAGSQNVPVPQSAPLTTAVPPANAVRQSDTCTTTVAEHADNNNDDNNRVGSEDPEAEQLLNEEHKATISA